MNAATTSVAGLAVAALAFGAAGCLPYTRATANDGAQFDLLYDKDLAGFEQTIAVENHVGAADAWTRVGEAWLALANCRPVDREPFGGEVEPTPEARFVHATLVLEDTRRRLRTSRQLAGYRRGRGTLLVERIRSARFFDRTADETPPEVIRWPSEAEQWADEKPAEIRVGHQCGRLHAQLREPGGGLPGRERDESNGERRPRTWTPHDWRVHLLNAIHRVHQAYRPLAETEREGRAAELYWRTRLYGAATAARWERGYRISDVGFPEGTPDRVVEALQPGALADRADGWLTPIVQPDSPAAAFLSEREMARAQLLGARMADAAGETDTAFARLDRAFDGPLTGANRWAARYLRLRLLTRNARWAEAAELADELPPSDSTYYAPYAYRVGLALRQLDRDDRFLGIAKEVFGNFPPKSDPYLRALYSELLRLSVQYEFEARVIELLEELGPRSGIYDRVAEFARICLSRGRPDNAEAAAKWLMRHHDDARFEPRYRGILALVAFQRNDPAAFRHQIEKMTERPESLLEAIPARRRARFFAPADSALARVLREMLPMMAEWGESAPAEKRRGRWLEIIVDQTQQFLRETDESIARSTLEEMYRLASALLEDHPRGYAERVGDEAPAPLVLGTVRVGAGELGEYEPTIDVRFREPYSLTMIPRDDRPISEWTFRWPPDEESTDEASTGGEGGSDA